MSTMQKGSPLRFAVIGVGAGIFKSHLQALEAIGAQVVGVADINPQLGRPQAQALGCAFYEDYRLKTDGGGRGQCRCND